MQLLLPFAHVLGRNYRTEITDYYSLLIMLDRLPHESHQILADHIAWSPSVLHNTIIDNHLHTRLQDTAI